MAGHMEGGIKIVDTFLLELRVQFDKINIESVVMPKKGNCLKCYSIISEVNEIFP